MLSLFYSKQIFIPFGSLQHKMFISSCLFFFYLLKVTNLHPTQLGHLLHTQHEPATFYRLICIPHCTSSRMTPHTLLHRQPSFHKLWERESNKIRKSSNLPLLTSEAYYKTCTFFTWRSTTTEITIIYMLNLKTEEP